MMRTEQFAQKEKRRQKQKQHAAPQCGAFDQRLPLKLVTATETRAAALAATAISATQKQSDLRRNTLHDLVQRLRGERMSAFENRSLRVPSAFALISINGRSGNRTMALRTGRSRMNVIIHGCTTTCAQYVDWPDASKWSGP